MADAAYVSAPARPAALRRRLFVIYNPTAGARRRKLFRDTLRHLAGMGCLLSVRETAGPGEAQHLARMAAEEGWDAIVVAGGDGTINDAMNGLAGTDLPLGIIPLGTANVLANELAIPFDAATVAQTIARGDPRTIYLGEAGGHLFTMMAGVGMDALVVRDVNLPLKRLTGKIAYWIETLIKIARYRPAEYTVTINGRPSVASSVIVAKGHYYGGRYTVAPAARLDDPHLHVCMFRRFGRGAVFRYGAGLVLNRLDRLPDVEVVPTSLVSIQGPPDAPVQADGDIIGRLPMTFSVASLRASVIAPPGPLR